MAVQPGNNRIGLQDVQNAPLPGGGGYDTGNTLIGGYAGDTVRLRPGDVPGASAMTPQAQVDAFRREAQRREESIYHDGDEYRELRNMTTEELARFQQKALSLGLASNVVFGTIDGGPSSGTLGAMRTLMMMSNRERSTWNRKLLDVSRAGGMADENGPRGGEQPRDPFRHVEQEYLPPDPAEVRNSIRDLAKQVVPDIDLSDDEVDYLRGQFEGMGRQQFDAAEEQRMNDARAQYAAEDPTATGETIVTSEGVAPVNAAERFREFFEERYRPNIERREGIDETSERRQVTGGNLGQLMQIATGGAR